MTLREKAALAGLVSVQLVYGAWFAGLLPVSGMAIVAIHFVLLAIIQVIVAARHGREPADERDIRIAQAAASFAFFVAMGSIVFTLAMLGLGTPPAKLVLVIVAGFALADMARYGLQFLGYRSA